MPTSKILWGPTLDGELVFAWPLLSAVTDRPPRDGSEWIRGQSGIEDAWITGRDYELSCEARWIPDGGASPSPVSGAQGWQAFLDYARGKGTFRFVPDQTLPGLYIDGCYLADPLRGFGSLTADIERAVPLLLRNPTTDFHLALRGLLFEYAAGGSLTDPITAALTRATAAAYHSRAGFVQSVAANLDRGSHFYGGARSLLIEGARTNSCLRSEELDNATWTKTRSSVTPNAKLSPDGVNVSADKLVEDATAANTHQAQQAITITSAEFLAVSCYVKAAERTRGRLQFGDATATNAFRVDFNLTAGTVSAVASAGAGVLTGQAIEPLANGWYRITMWGAVNGGITAGVAFLLLADGTGAISYNGDGASGMYWWGAQVERLSTTVGAPSAYIATTTATVTRNADNPFTWPYPYAPQSATFYVRLFDFTPSPTAVTFAVLQLGDAASVNPRWYIVKSTNTWNTFFTNEDGGSAGSTSGTPNNVYGDLVELVAQLDATSPGAATVKLHVATNGGAFAAAATSAPLRLPYNWNAQTLAFGLGAGVGYYGLRNVKLAAGVRTPAEMQAL